MLQASKASVMAMKSYGYPAELLVRDYILADPFVPYTSVLCGIVMCKMVRILFPLLRLNCGSIQDHGLRMVMLSEK